MIDQRREKWMFILEVIEVRNMLLGLLSGHLQWIEAGFVEIGPNSTIVELEQAAFERTAADIVPDLKCTQARPLQASRKVGRH